MDTWKQQRLEMDGALKLHVVPVLRNMGFKGSFPHFRRLSQDRVDAIGFQFSQWGPQLYVEIGIADPGGTTLLDGTHFPSGTLKYYQCPARLRIGSLPYDFDEHPVYLIAETIRDLVVASAAEWEKLYHAYRQRSSHGDNQVELNDAPLSPSEA